MRVSKISVILGAIGGYLLSLVGGWEGCLESLVVITVLDLISGCLVGFYGKSPKTKNGYFSSSVMRRGILSKSLYIIPIILAVKLQELLSGMPIGDFSLLNNNIDIRYLVIMSMVVGETVSICENLELLGIKLPSSIGKALEVLKKVSDISDEDSISTNPDKQTEENTEEPNKESENV